ncbi:hypothetical protein [Chryseobacterium sp.]|uniref:hypothetical protein n=1 Tax=Chryseobacterium sp. TaxID=1871047 RepID=UPI0011C796C5|nr:hypothetical protein [Chryseobacterium sp.]TXF76372.1 hypothetical protein FUA25_10845 [Chryseobacterium sp.]
MKKLLILIPLIALSCNKKEAVTETSVNSDSVKAADQLSVEGTIDSSAIKDSMINNAPATKEVLREGVMREVEGNEIIRTAPAEQLPFTIGEEFTKENQKFILKIKDYKNPKLSVKIANADPNLNVRINQIRFPDGTFDGPFGREVSVDTPKKGEYWIIVGHNLMADGKMTGKFSLEIE